ncbi:MAG: hypothetical protein M0R06_10545 [Sphaerochaeta sp.]|jgi:hypothetical protein|nr:hypothetical protein [Sphaerochaeta sp.]
MGQEYNRTVDINSILPSSGILICKKTADSLDYHSITAPNQPWGSGIQNIYTFNHDKAICLQVGGTDGAANDSANWSFAFPYASANFLTIETIFTSNSYTPMKEFCFGCTVRFTTGGYTLGIKWDCALMKWYILTALSTWTEITTGHEKVASNYWTKIQIDLNPTSGYYNKLILDNKIVDISAYTLYNSGASLYPKGDFYVYITSDAGDKCSFFIDSVILTQRLL